jgi:hypothetical protein
MVPIENVAPDVSSSYEESWKTNFNEAIEGINTYQTTFDNALNIHDAITFLGKYPVSEVGEKLGTASTLWGASKDLTEGIESFNKGNSGDGIYSTFKAAGTLGIFAAVGFSILAPEALLLWGAEVLIADAIYARMKPKETN